jgi:hypothetical protein
MIRVPKVRLVPAALLFCFAFNWRRPTALGRVVPHY